MNQRHMASIAEWQWEYCVREGARENIRASALLNQLIRLGLERREADKNEADKGRRIIDVLKAVV